MGSSAAIELSNRKFNYMAGLGNPAISKTINGSISEISDALGSQRDSNNNAFAESLKTTLPSYSEQTAALQAQVNFGTVDVAGNKQVKNGQIGAEAQSYFSKADTNDGKIGSNAQTYASEDYYAKAAATKAVSYSAETEQAAKTATKTLDTKPAEELRSDQVKVYRTDANDIRDPNGMFGNGEGNNRPFNGQWQNFQSYNQYWSDKGGYIDENGDYIDQSVMFKHHEYPGSEKTSLDEKTWMSATQHGGFLFKESEGMAQAMEYAATKLHESGRTDLFKSGWNLAFVAANEISTDALQGRVGEMLSYDQAFVDAGKGQRSTAMERSLHQQMHDITSKHLGEIAAMENQSIDHVKENLRAAGHDPDMLSTMNYRALMETSNNIDLIKDADAFAAKVKAHFDEHGFLPKFNIQFQYTMDARKGDSMAFADADRDLKMGQQSALKGSGESFSFSSNPNQANLLYYAVSGEQETENIQAMLSQAFERAGLDADSIMETYGKGASQEQLAALEVAKENGVVSQTGFDFSMHGGEEGTGLNQEGISAKDETLLDLGNTDANIMYNLASFSAKYGSDRTVMNADSCHGNRHAEKAGERFLEGVAAYDRANGTSSEMEFVRRGVDTFGTADAQGRGDENGYYTFKYGASGEKNLERVYSSERRVAGQGPTINKTLHYDGSGQYAGMDDAKYQEAAKEKFHDSVAGQTEGMNKYLDEIETKQQIPQPEQQFAQTESQEFSKTRFSFSDDSTDAWTNSPKAQAELATDEPKDKEKDREKETANA